MKKFIFLFSLTLAWAAYGQGSMRFSEIRASNQDEKHFKNLITVELLQADLKPAEFYVTKISDSADRIKLQLTYKSDFSQKYKKYRSGASGKSQICEYNKKESELVSCVYFR